MGVWLGRVAGLRWWLAAMLPALFMTGGGARMFANAMFADVLLAAVAIPALTLASMGASRMPMVTAGCLLAGVACWIKNEGAVVWLVVGLTALIGCGSRSGWWKSWLTGGLLWLLPWRWFVARQDFAESDFELSRPWHGGTEWMSEVVPLVGRTWLEHGWSWADLRFAGAWPALLAVLLFYALARLIWWHSWQESAAEPRNMEMDGAWLRLSLAALLTAAGVHGVYLFSAIDPNWHMLAMARTDLIPAGAALLAAAGLAVSLSRRILWSGFAETSWYKKAGTDTKRLISNHGPTTDHFERTNRTDK